MCGANAVFPKPFKVKEFEALLHDNLERDGRGRIVEKRSDGLDVITLGLMQQQQWDGTGSVVSEMGWIVPASPSFHFDDTSYKHNVVGLTNDHRDGSSKSICSMPPLSSQSDNGNEDVADADATSAAV